MGPCRLTEPCVHGQLVYIAPQQPVASHLKGPSPMSRVGLGRAAMSAFPRNEENLDLHHAHKLPKQRGRYLSGGLHCKKPELKQPGGPGLWNMTRDREFGGPSERTYNTRKLKEADTHTGESAWQPRKVGPGAPLADVRSVGVGCGAWAADPGVENIFVCLN